MLPKAVKSVSANFFKGFVNGLGRGVGTGVGMIVVNKYYKDSFFSVPKNESVTSKSILKPDIKP